jgi:hypothetical protein
MGMFRLRIMYTVSEGMNTLLIPLVTAEPQSRGCGREGDCIRRCARRTTPTEGKARYRTAE